MELILKDEIVDILNDIQRGTAPRLTVNEIVPKHIEISEHKFDLIDSKDGSPIRDFKTGTAHYINGKENDTYNLKIICYDDFLHQFTYDDGNGHTHVNKFDKYVINIGSVSIPKDSHHTYAILDDSGLVAYDLLNELGIPFRK